MNMLVRTAIAGTPLPAGSRTVVKCGDPIFSLIDRHRAAVASYKRAVNTEFASEEVGMKGKKLKQFQAMERATLNALRHMDETGAELMTTPPTTLHGIAAWAEYLEPLLNESDAPDLVREVNRSNGTSSTAAAAFASTLQSAIIMMKGAAHSDRTVSISRADQNSQRRAAGDERLWSLYDKFERAYFRVNELDTPAAQAGSLSSATPKEKKAQKQWARAADAAFRAARRVLAEPALTGDRLLMKIHVAGFEFDAARGTFTMPYEGASTPQWSPSGLSNEECAFIKSVGVDLRRAREALR